ncbi:MAG: transporter permease [Glaciihabitans sp.]|nr:transporter permease [Glaciihabitans sp.]
MNRTRTLPGWATALIGVVLILVVWEVAALVVAAGTVEGARSPVPTPLAVLTQLVTDNWSYYGKHISMTVTEAGIGFLWGNGLALVLAGLVLLAPRIEKVAVQIAVITYCIPIVAIGPIFIVVIGAPRAGNPSGTAIVLAALSVFFTTVIGSLVGLKAADKASLDVISVYGGGKFMQLRKVRVIAAIPSVITALKIAAPAAFLGAILGEYLGQVERGLGVAMLAAGSASQVERVWGIALVCGLIAGLGYAVFVVVARFVTPWSSGKSA